MTQVLIEKLLITRGAFQLFVDKISLRPGEILGVMGQSGSGKSSLLQAIAGFIPIQSGSVQVSGNEISHLSPEKRKVSLVFQRPWLFEHQTVRENVAFGLLLRGCSFEIRKSISDEWLKKMEISELSERHAWEISGGQAQRVALARALAVQFPLLLLDEPFSALDSTLKKGMRNLLKHLIRDSNYCAIFVSHDWRDIEAMSDKVLVLGEGKILAYEEPFKLRVNPDPRIKAICED